MRKRQTKVCNGQNGGINEWGTWENCHLFSANPVTKWSQKYDTAAMACAARAGGKLPFCPFIDAIWSGRPCDRWRIPCAVLPAHKHIGIYSNVINGRPNPHQHIQTVRTYTYITILNETDLWSFFSTQTHICPENQIHLFCTASMRINEGVRRAWWEIHKHHFSHQSTVLCLSPWKYGLFFSPPPK